MKSSAPFAACPDVAVLARAATQGEDEALALHLRGCPACAAELREQQALRALGARLPFSPPAPARRHELRAALLAQVNRPKTRRFALPITVGALAAAFALWLLRVQPSPPAPIAQAPQAPALISRVHIEAAAGARFMRTAGPPHEVVRLYEGQVRFDVIPATNGETFRVITGAGEVEVRGTVFETTAVGDRLVAVEVERGRVVVRPALFASDAPGAASQELALEAGHSWQRTPAPASEDPDDQIGAQEKPPVKRRATARPGIPLRRPDPAERAFGEGLALLRAADTRGAAEAFARAGALNPQGTLAEDAAYWRAIALNRHNSSGHGHEALKDFLDRFPNSARAGEAATMLGWLLLDRGEREAAARHLRTGLADPSARVRKSAQAGLDALAGRPSLRR